MKVKTIIDKNKDEEIIIYAHERSSLIDEIESLVNSHSTQFIGYTDRVIRPLTLSEIYSFNVIDNKVYARLEKEVFLLKMRLYVIEDLIDNTFVKINQSCIVNIKKIKKFDSTFTGTLGVELKNGYKDYVSRRQMKVVKERIGI